MDNILQRQHTIPGKDTTLWLDTTPATTYPPLAGDFTVDVAIIGGGITGLTTAFLLKRAGVKVAVLEMNRISSDVTGHSTAKLTAAHGLTYKFLMAHYGREKSEIYATANMTAIEQVVNWAEELKIDCDIQRIPAYTYVEDESRLKEVHEEVDTAGKLGLPVSYIEHFKEPFLIKGAIRYEDQVRFHPNKYLQGLARFIQGQGSNIFEQTRVEKLEEGNPCVITTNNGTVRAEKVLQANHFPFHDPMLLFSRMIPRRSYVMAVRLNTDVPWGMYYGYAKDPEDYHSFRPHPYEGGEILLIGGQQHKAGHNDDVIERYNNLAKYIMNTFDVKSFEYRWSTQDNFTVDHVPYIGQISLGNNRVYVGTGYKGWGMSQGTLAGILLAEEIQGRPHPWSELYKPSRVKVMTSAREFLTQNVEVAKDLVSGYLGSVPVEDVDALQPGEGKVVNVQGHKTAIYKDEDGEGHCVNPACTHMGCICNWNNAEHTWDCPCHGSRFNYEGKVIHGPATTNKGYAACRAKVKVQ